MAKGWPPYRNTIKTQAKTVGRIVRDLMSIGGKTISRFNSNAPIPPPPSPPVPTGCCCDRVVVVSKDDGTEFSTVQGAIDFIVANYTPSATAPWVVKICPGEYTEDVVGADYVSLVGIGTKKDAVRIIGVDGPTYTCPDGIHSVENILFRLRVDVTTGSPILIDAVDAPAVIDEYHIFSNCQFEITSVARTGELVRVGGTGITFEHCDFIYDNTDETLGIFTHEVIKLMGGSIVEFISCNFEASTVDDDDNLFVFSETEGEANELMVKDCRIKMSSLHIGATALATCAIYNAEGDGEEKYLQDNHIVITCAPLAKVNGSFVGMFIANSIIVTTNNNVVIYDVHVPSIAIIALTNTLNSHHDEFIDLRYGSQVPFFNAGTFNRVHSPLPGMQHISQYQDIDLPPGGKFFLPGNQAGIVSGAFRVIQINGVSWQKGGVAPTAPQYRFTPGVTGIYQVNAAIHCVAPPAIAGTYYRVGVTVNGVVAAQGTGHSSFAGFIGPTVSDQIEITNVADWVDLRLYHSDAVNPQTARGSVATTFFSIQKIS